MEKPYKTIKLANSDAFVIVDAEDYEDLSKIAWRLESDRYASIRKKKKGVLSVILMHRYILKAPNEYQVDHINGNGLDNRRSNLRLATRSQNLQNQIYRKLKRSSYKGVDLHKNRWRARITLEQKQTHIGYFETELIAAHAYDAKAVEVFGEFANLNFKCTAKQQDNNREEN